MKLKVKAVSPMIGNEIPLPAYATEGSAGLDLRACIDEKITVKAGGRVLIPSGIAIELPKDYVALVFARSGLAIKHGLALSNGVGVIDSDYRGEIAVGLINQGEADFVISPGERIAQLVVMPVVQPELELVDNLSDTARGAGGFGSTGTK
ncbi:MAG: dUTP diphosphatase [Ruminococcaceae bacterium]|nr:dUTP diphosphatase [Oscillospiraceae bacterium]